jgi:hypothetical protein
MTTNEQREAFEAWITQPPIEASILRYGDDAARMWRGQYKQYSVQLAWDAWRAAIEHAMKTMSNRN